MTLTLTQMTLILKLDLDMVKMYLHTKNEVSMSKGLKVIAWTDKQTHRHDWKHYLPAYADGNYFERKIEQTQESQFCQIWIEFL